ncbi:MAG: hypothetical protein AABX49_00175 [Nanoarchaeota archaeon]
MQEYKLKTTVVDRFVYRTVKPFLIFTASVIVGGYGYFGYEMTVNKKEEYIRAAKKAGIVFGSTVALITSPLLVHYALFRKREKNREDTSIDDVVQREAAQL